MAPLFYSGLALDRAGDIRRDAEALAALRRTPDTRWLPAWRGLSLVGEPPRALFAEGADGRRVADLAVETVFLGIMEGKAVFAADLSALDGGEQGPDLGLGGTFVPLRGVAARLPAADAALLAYARGMFHWHDRHRHCGACGAPTISEAGGHVRRCTAAGCGLSHFPRTDPAVIVLVADETRCLLGRQASWPPGMYSCLAGFVEPGESLEETVVREVLEETGIAVGDVRYLASQPWPFPSSLMVAFAARPKAGELRIDSHELEDARWFSLDEVRRFPRNGIFLPPRDSIARLLIDDWRERAGG